LALSPILNLPVRWQVLGVDIESIVPHRGFAAEAYDVANVNGIFLVENPVEQEVRLVLPFPTERASAGVRVVSTDKVTSFKKRDGGAGQFVEYLRTIGEIPASEEPILKDVRAAVREFHVADVEIPAGPQVIRFYARQELEPLESDPRAFEVVFFAPLAGLVFAGGQSMASVSVAFPPAWAAPGLAVGQPTITPLPGQPAPTEQPSTATVAERPLFGWLWRQDPKVTIPYRYG
jgi:hypothetical protein